MGGEKERQHRHHIQCHHIHRYHRDQRLNRWSDLDGLDPPQSLSQQQQLLRPGDHSAYIGRLQWSPTVVVSAVVSDRAAAPPGEVAGAAPQLLRMQRSRHGTRSIC
jgi:hypothetical protein